MNFRISSLFALCISLLTLTSVSQWSSITTTTTTVSWLLMSFTYFTAIILFLRSTEIPSLPYEKVLIVYLVWVCITAARGAWVADNYWEYKNLIQGTSSVLMPLLIWVLASPLFLGKCLKIWMRFALPAFAVFFFLLSPGAYGYYLAPLVLGLILLPLLRLPQQILVLGFAGIVVLSNLDGRSNILRFTLPLLFMGLFFFRNFMGTATIRIVAFAFFLAPPALLLLGINGTFNIFKMQDHIQPGTMGLNEEDYLMATADTRTFLYKEVWNSAVANNYIWTGRTLARGYDSEAFGHKIESLTGTGKIERYSSEVGLHNIFTWMGISGVVLYSTLFLVACHLAINYSNSFSLKIMGLYLAFRWAYCWVEEFTVFGINYFVLWILVAICWSPKFRAMTDLEIREWVRPIIPGKLALRTRL